MCRRAERSMRVQSKINTRVFWTESFFSVLFQAGNWTRPSKEKMYILWAIRRKKHKETHSQKMSCSYRLFSDGFINIGQKALPMKRPKFSMHSHNGKHPWGVHKIHTLAQRKCTAGHPQNYTAIYLFHGEVDILISKKKSEVCLTGAFVKKEKANVFIRHAEDKFWTNVMNWNGQSGSKNSKGDLMKWIWPLLAVEKDTSPAYWVTY